MKDNKLDELIDGFLKNNLDHVDQVRLQEILQSDPAAQVELANSQKTYRYILHLRYKNIREQLYEYDQHQILAAKPSNARNIIQKSAAVLFIFLISFITIHIAVSPQHVSRRNLESLSQTSNSHLNAEQSFHLATAQKYFQAHDYQQAALLYQSIPADVSKEIYNLAQWNYLMCYLALEGATPKWKSQMSGFLIDAEPDLKRKGYKILRLYDSAFFHWTFGVSPPEFSTIQPRLI